MYPGLLSTLLPNQQKKTVNRYDYRPFEQQERIGMASYHQSQLYERMQPSGKGMKFYPEIHVEFTLPYPYLKNSNVKPRLKWALELQERFVQSVDALGGEKNATPKKIWLMMNATGLTLSHLKSHLQKYRIALRVGKKLEVLPPLRRPRVNLKKKTSSRTASSGRRGSSSSTKKSGANKWKAESSKARKGNGNKPLKIQDVEMAMEGTNKTGGNQAIFASPSASRKGKEPAIPTFGSQAIIAPAFASSKGKEPVIQTMGNKIIGTSAFASAKGKEPAIDFETSPYPFQPGIFDIQFENYYPVHYSREEVIVRTRNVAGASVKEQIAFYQPFGQASISQNLAYVNHSTTESNSSLGLAGASRTIFANYQMNTSSSFSSMFEKSMDPASNLSSMFENSMETGSSFSSMFGNSINTGSSFSSAYGNVNTGSSLSSTFSNSMDTDSSLSSMFWNSTDPGSSFSSMFANPMRPGSNFPSMIANPMGPRSSFSPMVANPMGPGSSFSPIVANPMEPGLSFPSMVANPMGPGSRFAPMVANPMEPGSSFSPMVANSMEPGSSFPSLTANPMGPGSSFSPMVANPMEPGSSFSSVVTNKMGPGSSFSSMVANPIDVGLCFFSTFEASADNGSSLSSTFGNSTDTGSGSSVFGNWMNPGTSVFNLDENGLITGDFGLDSGDFFHGITGMLP